MICLICKCYSMKNMLLLFGMMVLLSTSAFSRENEVVVASRLKEVTLFRDGAQQTRTSTLQVGAGTSLLVFSSLPAGIDAGSIQVSARGNFTILSATLRINYMEQKEQSRRVRLLQDSLAILNKQVTLDQGIVQALEEEQGMVLANKTIGGTETGVKVSELRAAADFLRERLRDIKQQQQVLNQRIDDNQQIIRRLQKERRQAEDSKSRATGEILVQVSSPAATRGEFTLSYLTREAGWKPLYDIRVPEDDQPVELVLKASAYQHTGEDWNDVILTFSTGDPRQRGQRPVLYPWRLSFIEPRAATKQAPEILVKSDHERMEFEVMESLAIVEDAVTASSYTDARETRTTHEYRVDKPYDMATRGLAQVIELKTDQVPALYEYFVVPRVNSEAFLVTRIPEPGQYNLMEAEASLFFGSTFLGKTLVNPRQIGDTLELSLGKDPSVVVARERMTDFTRKNLFGSRVTETIGWEVSLKNNRKREVTINLQEQVPVSVHEDLQVDVEEKAGAEYDPQRGFLTWRLQLAPGQTQERSFRYSVKYPKGKYVILE